MVYKGSLQTTTGGRGRPVGNASISTSVTGSSSQTLRSSGGDGSRTVTSSSQPVTTPGIIQAIKNAPNSPLAPTPTLPEFYANRRANNARAASAPPNNPTNAAISNITKPAEPAPYTSGVGYSTNQGYTLLYAKKQNPDFERRQNDKEALGFFVRSGGTVGRAATANAGTLGLVAGARIANPALRRATSKAAVDRQTGFIAERAYTYTPEFLKSKDRINYSVKESPTVGKTRTAQFVYGVLESPKNIVNAPLPSAAKATKTGAALFLAGFGSGALVNAAGTIGRGAIAQKAVIAAGAIPLVAGTIINPRGTGREAPFIAVGAASFGKGYAAFSPPKSFTPTELQYVKADTRMTQTKISSTGRGTVTGTLTEFGNPRIINIPAKVNLRGQKTGDTFYVKAKTTVEGEFGGEKTYLGTFQPSNNRLLLRNKGEFFFSETTPSGQQNNLLGAKNINVAGTIKNDVPTMTGARKGFVLAESERYNAYNPKILQTKELSAFSLGRPTEITQTSSFGVTRARPNDVGRELFLRGSKDFMEKGIMQQPRVRQTEGFFRSRRGSLGSRNTESILEPQGGRSRPNLLPKAPSFSGLPVASSFKGRNPALLTGGFSPPSMRGYFQQVNIPKAVTTGGQQRSFFQFDTDTRTTPNTDQEQVFFPSRDTRTIPRQISDPFIPSTLVPPVITPPSFSPPDGLLTPNFGIGGGGRVGGGGRRQSFSYTPSLTATLFNIRGRRPSNPLGGFELRPIQASSRRKRR